MNDQPAQAAALERYGLALSYGSPPATLNGALAKGSLAVTGTVQANEFKIRDDGLVYTYTTLRIESVQKGQPPASGTVTFIQSGGPMEVPIDNTHKETVLAQSPGDPILLVGERATVILATAEYAGSGIYVSAWPNTSQYPIRGGRITALPENPFAAQVNGRTEAEFISQLASAR